MAALRCVVLLSTCLLAGCVYLRPAVESVFKTAPVGHREVLVVESYWRARGRSNSDDERITLAIETLARDRANHQYLIMIAHELRHPAFVPFLIANHDRDSDRRAYLWSAQKALEKLTFQVGITEPGAWQQWWVAQPCRPSAWLNDAPAALRRLLQQDETAAEAFFSSVVDSWNVIELLPFVEEELIGRPRFGDEIVNGIDSHVSSHLPVPAGAVRAKARPPRARFAPRPTFPSGDGQGQLARIGATGPRSSLSGLRRRGLLDSAQKHD